MYISIHALRVEGDQAAKNCLSARRISIHALRVEGDIPTEAEVKALLISIHALRVEGDWIVKTLMLEGNDFYPRPPGGGRPARSSRQMHESKKFLSTPSGWRATLALDLATNSA